ncbi:hypothetical protein LMG28614_00769 [Paraburkholderia ultramafica]|uniref:CobQ/CobB/MinD/ParA nucleotide binding domain-containing protein n=1 Tax=Paraburkholderia ultramafica TaxID=1544867 RepID=A0A6S7B6H2_9BURK|nr:AAA family ATPase [Paraburkholderia ultramafica]CAB3779227.1 hypothetical protein LMG28614_00769 [Paraburkholderia ultramafica]
MISDDSSQTLIAAMRAGIRDVLGWPVDKRSLGDALLRAESQRTLRGARETQVVSFISCKGGAGTSLIASNIAHAIAATQEQRVLLIDLNQSFGDAAFLLTDEIPASTLPQMCTQVGRMDAAFFDASLLHVSENFHVLAGAGNPVKAADIKEDRLEWIMGVAVPRYDFVVIDLGQTINQLSILALDRSDQIHMVLQASMPHVRAGRQLQEILASLGCAPDQIRLLLNRYARHGERARAALEEVLGMRPYQFIPEDVSVVAAAMDQGLPIAKTARGSSVSRSLQMLAENIVKRAPLSGRNHAQGESLFARMLGRNAGPKPGTM